MTRTLADMTPAEQAQCVGMWADFQPASTPRPVVILHAEEAWGRAAVFDPTAQVFEPIAAPSGWVTPRFDLPRAWTPDGEPVPGEWKEGHMRPYDGNVCACGSSTGCPGDTPVRRYITDWEVAP